ncbi:MAG: hypothetical protein AB8H79_00430 [Myxococcota bacterium]
MPTSAWAASPWTVPKGAASVYAGASVATFDVGMSGADRDRQLQLYAVGWAGYGLSDRTQLDLSTGIAHHRVLENPLLGPCPSTDDYCQATTGLSQIQVGLTRRLTGGNLPTAIRIGLSGDPWNRGQRGRWTNIGQGVVAGSLDGTVQMERSLGKGQLTAALSGGGLAPLPRRASIGTEQRWVIAPTARASLESAYTSGPVRLGVTLFAHQRLWGLPFGAEWVQSWRPSQDRWAVTRWGEVRPELKLSIEPADGWGIHVSASRPVWVQAGPTNLWNANLGVHRYVQGPSD